MPELRRPGASFSAEEIHGSWPDRFRTVAQAHPDHVALAFPAKPMTYAELDAITDRAASAIREAVSTPRAHIAVAINDELTSVAAMISVLKSGHVFLPIDTAWPESYQRTMLQAMGADLLLMDDDPPACDAGIPSISWSSAIRCSASPPNIELHSNDPASMFFTSGSTGDPKGIVLSHQCLLNAARNYILNMEIGSDDRIAWTNPLSTGASMLPIMSALLSGASLHRFNVNRLGFTPFVSWINEHRISVWPSVPSLFRSIAELLPPGPNLPSLRIIKLGGETVHASDIALFEQHVHEGCALMNGLGITECGGNICWHRHQRDSVIDSATLPIGRAVDGMRINLGNNENPGATEGEIVVQCRHLALGYWNPDSRQIDPLPGLKPDGETEFHTGDRARIDSRGELVHTGRMDDMLKVRGYRVERTGIEAALMKLPWIREAAVAMESIAGTGQLVAFIAWRDQHITEIADLRERLQKVLPPHGIPSRFYTVPQLPRLASGKINYRKLLSTCPPVESETVVTDALERQLLVLWRKALARKHVAIDADFFAAGGDSLAAVRFFALLDQRMGINLPLSTLSRYRTVRSLANHVRQTGSQLVCSSAHLLQAGDHRTPLFCFPGAGSDSMALIDLAESLDPRQTVYAMQYAGLAAGENFQRNIPEMSARFLMEIRRIQPSGPYALAGTSFGGWVAFDIAQQLVGSGEKVALLALLDTFGPGYPEPHPDPTLRRRLLLTLRWWLPLGNKDELSLSNLAAGVREKADRLFARMLIRLRPDRLLPLKLRYLHLQDCCFAAGKSYQAQPFQGGPIHLFRAEIQPSPVLFQPVRDMGWSALAAGGLHIHDVPGQHGAHIRKPNVLELAQKLMPFLPGLLASEAGRFVELRDQSRDRWDALAAWWDEQSGDEGHADTRELLLPLCLRLLNPVAGQHLIDAGCGNGWFARLLAQKGARVTAFDFSAELLALGRKRDANGQVDFLQIDATRPDQLAVLGQQTAEAAICYMALMDIADIKPLMESLKRAVRPGGCFVFAMIHPDSAALSRASDPQALTNLGKAGQPVEHYYFHRPMPWLLDLFEKTGWELDQLSSPVAPSGARFLVGRLTNPSAR